MSRFIRNVLLSLSLLGFGDALADHCPDVAAAAAEIAAQRDHDPAAGVIRGRELLADLQERHNCPLERTQLMAAIGANLNILGRNDEAAEILEAALLQAGDEAPDQLRADLHRGAGLAWYDLDDLERALEHYLASLAAAERAGDRLSAARTAGNIGILYITLGQLDRAEEYHRIALAAFEAAEATAGIAGTLINLGSLAARRAEDFAGVDDEAAHRYNTELGDHNRRALALFEQLGNPRGVAYAAANVGLSHDRLGQPELALPFHRRALEARQNIGDRHGVINSLVTIAASLTALQQYDEAEAALLEAEQLLPDSHLSLRVTVLQPWVQLEEARGDLAGALERHRELARVRAEMTAADNVARTAEIEARFQSERQARQIAALEYEQARAEERIARQRTTTLSAVAIAGLLLALIVALLARYQLKMRSQQELERAARTDPLTGLANRRHMRERIEYEIQRTRRTTRPFTVGLIDIDNFKQINDTFGHAIGDKLLVTIAERFRNMLRKQDTLARWGGDELLMLLPETDEAGALALARKIVSQVAEQPLTIDDRAVSVSVTIGVAQYWPGMDIDQCLQSADDAMYLGKQSGRSQARAKRP